jgi:hypothetical protein
MVLYYHNTNTLFTTAEKMAWDISPYLTSIAYTGQESPYWDGTPKYTSQVELTTGTQITGGTLIDSSDFYGTDVYYRTYDPPGTLPAVGIPYIKQYFRAYKIKTTTYCWDFANRLTKWFDDQTPRSCMYFTYDHAGNRITKSEGTAGSTGKLTKYVTQGNNVIYEDVSDVTSFTCPTSC